MSLRDWHGYPILDAERPDQMALPIIVNVPSSHVTHEETLLAVGRGIALLFDAEDAAPGGAWHGALAQWSAGNIRKVVRRAKKNEYEKVRALPGVESWHGAAKVRILLPHLISERPEKAVHRLQVSLDLPRQPEASEADSGALRIACAPDVNMTTGKAAAQVGHAVQMAIFGATEEELLAWGDTGFQVEFADWQDAPASAWFVEDAGYTEVEPGTRTVCSFFA